MAIATTDGHVNRALDFFHHKGKYFIIGGTKPWADETTPPQPSIDSFMLNDVVGLKRVDNLFLVVPDEKGSIQYRSQNWRRVQESITTNIVGQSLTKGNQTIQLSSLTGIAEGTKLRIGNAYEGVVQSIKGNSIILDTKAPADFKIGTPIIGGAIVEKAKYVYMDCYLNYDTFPLCTYRQIGLCTDAQPNNQDILKGAEYSTSGKDEYTSLGVLEIIDNRIPATRDINQREMISLIVEL